MSTNIYTGAAADRRAARRVSTAVRDLAGDRVLGIVGALTVIVATGLSWYSQELTISVGGIVDHSTTGLSLWHVRNLAAWLVCAGAVIGVAALLAAPRKEWRGGIVAAVAGFGVSLYSLVGVFTVPDLGSGALVGAHIGAAVSSSVDIGPFVAGLGGFLLFTGGIAASRDGATVIDAGG